MLLAGEKVFEKGDVVLSAYESGNVLPAWAPVRVVYGHSVESVGSAELGRRVARFFSAGDDAERLALLEEYGVDYVWWGPIERELGDYQLESVKYLRLVFESGVYTVFEVIH